MRRFSSKWQTACLRTIKLDLPMSRQDIADYLGLTIETVSRTLTDLENNSAISLLSSRRVVLRNRLKLSQMAARPASNSRPSRTDRINRAPRSERLVDQ